MPQASNEARKTLFLCNRTMSRLMVSCRLVVIKQLCKEHVKNATICCEKVSIAESTAFWTSEWQRQGQDTNHKWGHLRRLIKNSSCSQSLFPPYYNPFMSMNFVALLQEFFTRAPCVVFIPYSPKIFAFPSKSLLWKKTKRSCATFLNASVKSCSYKQKPPKSCATVCRVQVANSFRCFYSIDSPGFKQTYPGTIRNVRLVGMSKVMIVIRKKKSNKLL